MGGWQGATPRGLQPRHTSYPSYPSPSSTVPLGSVAFAVEVQRDRPPRGTGVAPAQRTDKLSAGMGTPAPCGAARPAGQGDSMGTVVSGWGGDTPGGDGVAPRRRALTPASLFSPGSPGTWDNRRRAAPSPPFSSALGTPRGTSPSPSTRPSLAVTTESVDSRRRRRRRRRQAKPTPEGKSEGKEEGKGSNFFKKEKKKNTKKQKQTKQQPTPGGPSPPPPRRCARKQRNRKQKEKKTLLFVPSAGAAPRPDTTRASDASQSSSGAAAPEPYRPLAGGSDMQTALDSLILASM